MIEHKYSSFEIEIVEDNVEYKMFNDEFILLTDKQYQNILDYIYNNSCVNSILEWTTFEATIFKYNNKIYTLSYERSESGEYMFLTINEIKIGELNGN